MVWAGTRQTLPLWGAPSSPSDALLLILECHSCRSLLRNRRTWWPEQPILSCMRTYDSFKFRLFCSGHGSLLILFHLSSVADFLSNVPSLWKNPCVLSRSFLFWQGILFRSSLLDSMLGRNSQSVEKRQGTFTIWWWEGAGGSFRVMRTSHVFFTGLTRRHACMPKISNVTEASDLGKSNSIYKARKVGLSIPHWYSHTIG